MHWNMITGFILLVAFTIFVISMVTVPPMGQITDLRYARSASYHVVELSWMTT